MSNIAYGSIDATYPVAGQDNNSQGFRDNFSYIKAGLQVAAAEITALEETTVKTDKDNDLNGARLSNATVNRLFSEVRVTEGMITGDPGINVQGEGWEYHRYTIGDSLWITFGGWPKDVDDNPLLGKVRIELVSDGTARTVSFEVSPAGGTVMVDSSMSGSATITTPATAGNSVVYDVWSADGGSTMFVSRVGVFTPAS
jgi:hypothetical protein